MASYLITGSSRGLGLELATQLAALPASEVGTIFASSRSEAPAIKTLSEKYPGRVVGVQLDTASAASIKTAVETVGKGLNGKGLDVLINNAAIMPWPPKEIAVMDDLEEHLKINAFIPLLQKGDKKKIVNVSSTLGSLALAKRYAHNPAPSYDISKTALNSLTVQYALAYEKEGFSIFALSPGWLRTDLGGEYADLSVEEGTKAVLDKILPAGPEQNGQFLNIYMKGWEEPKGHNNNQYDGLNPPW